MSDGRLCTKTHVGEWCVPHYEGQCPASPAKPSGSPTPKESAGGPSPEAVYTKTNEEERSYAKWKADQIFDGGNKKRWRELTELAIYMEYLRGKNDAECDAALAIDAAREDVRRDCASRGCMWCNEQIKREAK